LAISRSDKQVPALPKLMVQFEGIVAKEPVDLALVGKEIRAGPDVETPVQFSKT
jgi:hypothetical protein